MSKGRQKSKINKLPRAPRILSPKTRETALLPPNMAKLRPERTVVTSKEMFIVAPVENCFKILASQLEQPPGWDPLIVDTQPISNARGRIGATSQVTLNLGGMKVESLAMISRYHPNHAVSWVITRKPKVREDWQLERKPHVIQVRVTLAHELGGWVIGRLIYKAMRRKRLEQDLDTTLTQLKAAAESTSRDQSGIGKSKL